MEFKVEKEYLNTRLDKYIRRKYKLNLNDIFKLISNGKILVNSKKQRQNYRLKDDDIIYIKDSIKFEEKKFIELSQEELSYIQNSIIFEDDNLLIFNKEAGSVMHKGSGHNYGLSEMLKSYTNNEDFTFVNRIDRETSGLIIGSKNLETTRKLSQLIAQGKVIKRYYILVEGIVLENFEVVSYLLKTNNKVEEYDTWIQGAKEGRSAFKLIKNTKNNSLLEGSLGTGRTHQLRVQLSKRKHPIVGDKKYGSSFEGYMHLFSHELIIEEFAIHINLDIPTWFATN